MPFLTKFKENMQRWTTITPSNLLYDRTLLWLFVILLFIGFIMVTSASIPVGTRIENNPFHFAVRDALYVFLSFVTFYIFLKIHFLCPFI